jgi:CRP-like cAMP-binding protein
MKQEDYNLLARVPLFSVMPREALKFVLESSDRRTYRGGEVLFQQGQVADSGFLILRGTVMLSTTPVTQDRIIYKGQFIGEMAVLIEQRRLATAIAREPSEVLRIQSQAFKKVCHEFPQAAFALSQMIAARLNTITDSLARARESFEAISV